MGRRSGPGAVSQQERLRERGRWSSGHTRVSNGSDDEDREPADEQTRFGYVVFSQKNKSCMNNAWCRRRAVSRSCGLARHGVVRLSPNREEADGFVDGEDEFGEGRVRVGV